MEAFLFDQTGSRAMPFNVFARELRRLADPLSDETRKVRKALMVWSLIAFLMTVGGLFPTEVTALGLKLTTVNKTVLLSVVTAVLTYHAVTFVLYGLADAVAWYVQQGDTEYEEQLEAYEDMKRDLLNKAKLSEEERRDLDQVERHLGIEWRSGRYINDFGRVVRVTPYVSWSRAVLDFGTPVLCGLVSAVFLGRALLHP